MKLPIGTLLKKATNTIAKTTERHLPTILVGLGIVSFGGAVVYTAAKATPEAMERKKEAEEEKGEPLTTIEVIKTVGECYIPVGLMMSVGTAAILVGHHITLKRLATVSAAYSTVEKLYSDYKEKTKEVIGDRKETEIRDRIAKKQLDDHPYISDEGLEELVFGNGSQLCFDGYSGRYFKSDVETIRKKVNEFNRLLITEGWETLNEYYRYLGLPEAKVYEGIGFNARRSLVELCFSSFLVGDNVPCLVVNFRDEPGLDFDTL